VKLKSNVPFLGREAILTQRDNGVDKMLAGFAVADPDVVLLGRETIYRNGERCGWLTSGGWGYTVERNIGYGYVRNGNGVDRDYVLSGTYELEVATERVPCDVFMEPLYDPGMERVKG
jgi:4-methylaminobutanoate oxidase (formaldehyde-forming)